MNQSIQHKRKEAMFLKVLGEIISEEVNNVHQAYPTVTAVKLAKDDGHLTVYVTFSKNSEKALADLNKAKSFIRSALTRIPNLRRVPNLDFKIDDSLARANQIEKILAGLKTKK